MIRIGVREGIEVDRSWWDRENDRNESERKNLSIETKEVKCRKVEKQNLI